MKTTMCACVCVYTYSLRCCPGAGGTTVCAELWTEPMWRYLEPGREEVIIDKQLTGL